ncbi:ADAMTS-like protein 2 isoform X2 [Clarias gariepinus]|uniref:ADAMTS-like protein 2 isoform X2 n=1 Tax=Clarias gariepinus TaxID=13013 RepID=UPI00234C6744|nr:ADAMTS-like protein 2 isoform X2 [Clarias gariepinus]
MPITGSPSVPGGVLSSGGEESPLSHEPCTASGPQHSYTRSFTAFSSTYGHLTKPQRSALSREGTEELHLEEVAQWWGEWSSWSTCSWTCGGGVRSQERHCLQQRLTSTHNINSSFCVGSPKRYQLCTNQPCPNSRISFKQHQCSQFNSKAFSRKHYEWVPLYPDDYISISSKPCDLQCTTTTGERQLLVPAHDGTFCRNGVFKGICIEGHCQVVGCDGKLYSSKSVDRCGVCGGSGDTCYRISGSFRKGITQLGYAFITNIPVGATDIQIVERRKTENILALSDEAGHFFFNGNTVIDNPRNFPIAGTVFKYRRPVTLFSDGFEYIMAQGPTQQGLNVMYYNLNGKMPHITYEYTVPRVSSTPASFTQDQHPISSMMANTSYPQLPITGNEVEDRREKSEGTTLDHKGTMEARGDVRWEHQAPCNLSENSEALRLRESGKQDSFGSKLELIEGDSSIVNNETQAMVKSVRNKLYKLLSCADGTSISDCSTLKPNSSSPMKKNLALQIHTTSQREHKFKPGLNSTSQSRAQLLQLQQGAPEHLPLTDSNEFEVVSLDHDVSPAGVYRWKVSAYAPCSSSCTTGITTAYALCVRYDGSEVDESYCGALTRPEPTYEFCTGRECLPRWETSRWSECSRTCGEGFQFRTVRCWKMMAPGFDSSVYDDLCHGAELHKPMSRKSCRTKSCGPQWEVSDWSECSARCGRRGVRSREVRCSMDTRMCNESTRPPNQRECDGPPCDRRWTVSDWGPCSGPCGEGRMMRYVVCKSGNGKVISDGHCDRELKPLTVQPCGAPNCLAHWVEQEWERCNATCGRGVKSRQVVCAGLEAGVFKEFLDHACAHSPKPEERAPCFERPCSKWFTTSWSQCSKTCGSGVRVREVRCYQGEEIGHSCDSTLKPQARQSCEVQACPTEAPEDVCEDKATANCALVLKVKLCTHWYYRKACCLSCKTKGH